MKASGLWHYFTPLYRRRYVHTSNTEQIGLWGEKIAASFLQAQGFKVLVRRYQGGGGEIDLVCRDGNTLVFVEVKARGSIEFGNPSDFVDSVKQRKLCKAALSYLRLLDNPPIYFRFDIVEVLLQHGQSPVCNLLMNAFDLAEPYIY